MLNTHSWGRVLLKMIFNSSVIPSNTFTLVHRDVMKHFARFLAKDLVNYFCTLNITFGYKKSIILTMKIEDICLYYLFSLAPMNSVINYPLFSKNTKFQLLINSGFLQRQYFPSAASLFFSLDFRKLVQLS